MERGKRVRKDGLLWLATWAFVPVAQGHHSLVAEFDVNEHIELRGTVTELDWLNPHIWLYLEVTAADGSLERWECEMGSPNELVRAGWKKEDLPLGAVIRAKANPARNGSTTCSTRNVTLDDGTPLFTRYNSR